MQRTARSGKTTPPPQRTPAEAPLHVFQKNAREQVRASLSTFHGRLYGDLRVYVEDGSGQPRPTRKGLTVSVELLDELASAVKALKRAVGERETES